MKPLFDEDVVLAKVASIERSLGTIRRLWNENDPDLPHWVRLDVTVLNLQRAIESCLDLANHLIAANSWGLPGSAVEAVQVLVERQVLPRAALPVYRGMIGFRNVAVHNYREIDERIVHGIVEEHLDDLERFARDVLTATVNAPE